MLRKVLNATQQASESARKIDGDFNVILYQKLDIAEGNLTVGTMTWRTVVLLPPFASPPQITLSREGHGPGEPPEIKDVTPDTFAACIFNSDQSGKWLWRARGMKIARDFDVVQGTVKLRGWKTTVLLPPFVTPPQVMLVRPDGRTRQDPVVDEVLIR
jgi:hypothetical protein